MRKLALIFLLTACSGGGAEDTPEEPIECDPDDRAGTYLFEYTETDGNCGPVPDTLARLDSPNIGMMGSTECVVTDENWSRRNCRVERSWECFSPEGSLLVFTGFTDSNASGSRITGMMSVTVELECASTYDLTGTRQ